MQTFWNKIKAGFYFLVVFIQSLNAQQQMVNHNETRIFKPIIYLKRTDFKSFITQVENNNFQYLAEKQNLSIAEAQVIQAGISPDPEISFGYFDNDNQRTAMGYGFSTELSWTLELGGKRKSRINLAKSELELSNFLLQDFFRNLRAEATVIYLQALLNQMIYEVQLNSYLTVKKLADSDSIRHKLGAINEIDALQSRLEARYMLNNVIQAESEWKKKLTHLSVLTGKQAMDTLIEPQGDFNQFDRNFTLEELITSAKANRPDLLASITNNKVADNFLKLALANRMIDLGLNLSGTYASYTKNIIAPTPSFFQVGAGISLPLKFSNNRPGELQTAYYLKKQNEHLFMHLETQIQSEVLQAYYDYISFQKQVKQFNTGLLKDAKAVLDGKIYSYQRGETSLLEVLNAQRTYNEIQLSYYQTLYDYAAALVELERASGIWDINF
ncbi:MAG: TolC family protein [Flavobacteriales bacterium]|nr:TolC family protein [Flavobacteriales bacterium]